MCSTVNLIQLQFTSGDINSQTDKVLTRWKEYFQNFLSVSIIPERQQQISERTDNHDEIAPPTYNEICMIINKLKTDKAAATDDIIGELINPSAWGHLNPSSYCDVGRLFYGVFKLRSKLQRKK